ncbi:MAG: hypothetical protein ACMVY4_05170 [Minwuia sp.]|uniref:hypothetical protein n=1 Tax=Minwuia sp. TaxID=2493630 RepID=UPI003A8721EF
MPIRAYLTSMAFRLNSAILFALGLLPLAAAAQERGEAPPSIGREEAIRELQQDNVLNPGVDAAEMRRLNSIGRLQGLDARRQQRNDYADQRMNRLLSHQADRQAIRDARGFNPDQRRLERRRDRVDRRLRARINRAIKSKQ